jgi:AraC-like DNA-binding protein
MTPEFYPKIYLYRRIVQAKLFIDKFYFNHIDLDNIADEAYFSKFHFIRLFKKIYNKTPHQYLIYVRIEKAMQLLQSNTTVSEVCFSIGFNSISSFTGLFKKTVGLTPSGYQNKQHQLKIDIARSPLKFIPNCFAVKNGWT